MEKLFMETIEANRHLIKDAKLPSYIPALSLSNINDIGCSYVDENGKIFKFGDYDTKFTIQSISKPIALILAIKENGMNAVFERVGCEGTNDAFNSFIELDIERNPKPANPLINSGAILTTSLIKGTSEEKINKLLEITRLMASNPTIGINYDVYKSESETDARNRAMTYLMKDKGVLKGNIEDMLEVYFKQCSIVVDTVDLANIGRFISTGLEGLSFPDVSNEKMVTFLRAILTSCGMYNYSTRFAIDVGIPAKSGVGGGIMGVLDKGRGIGVYSPGIDDKGNSVVGMAILNDLSNKLNLNSFNSK
ncbi:MAG: glutaminase A [Gudongella sp.]|nr:glutaminase A [Gudongella sp.]